MFLLFFVLLIARVINGQSLEGPTHGKKVVCYWARWAYYHPVPGHPRFQLGSVDPSLCTHLIYFNAIYDIDRNIIRARDPWQDLRRNNGTGNFLGIASFKKLYPHMKVLIAVGDLDDGPLTFSRMASEPEMRKIFVRNVKRFLKRFGFDGLDIHWYFPTMRGGAPYDRLNFVQLAKELSAAFKPRGYVLSATIGVLDYILDVAYDLEGLSRHLDIIHMDTRNYHDAGDGVIGGNAPMKGSDEDDTYSVGFTVHYVLSHGVPPHKLVLGIPFHGRNYNLVNSYLNKVQFGRSPTKLHGFKGPFTDFVGTWDYMETCWELSNASSPWRYYWDANSETPYLRDQGRVISYDNARSVAIKIKLGVDKGFGGFAAFSIDRDDYLGICSPESHDEAAAYADFAERLNIINNDTLLDEALKTLKFPSEKEYDADTEGPSYVLLKKKLKLQLPPRKKQIKFKLTSMINDFTKLSIQEKRVLDEIKRITKENMEDEFD